MQSRIMHQLLLLLVLNGNAIVHRVSFAVFSTWEQSRTPDQSSRGEAATALRCGQPARPNEDDKLAGSPLSAAGSLLARGDRAGRGSPTPMPPSWLRKGLRPLRRRYVETHPYGMGVRGGCENASTSKWKLVRPALDRRTAETMGLDARTGCSYGPATR